MPSCPFHAKGARGAKEGKRDDTDRAPTCLNGVLDHLSTSNQCDCDVMKRGGPRPSAFRNLFNLAKMDEGLTANGETI